MGKADPETERIKYVAPSGTRKLYKEVAALEGLATTVWMRKTLHEAAVKVLKAHARSTKDVPPAHPVRPPRLQPRFTATPKDST